MLRQKQRKCSILFGIDCRITRFFIKNYELFILKGKAGFIVVGAYLSLMINFTDREMPNLLNVCGGQK